MTHLKGLSSAARVAVTDEFRRGNALAADIIDHVEKVEFGREMDLSPLREVIEYAMKRFDPRKSDAWLGPRVHATLRLSRREAADKRLWQYLTIAEFPDYVRWRWMIEDGDKAVPLDRFFGEDSKNALARLWWASELTRNGPCYSRTEVALGISRFSVSWLHLILVHHRPCALAVVDFLKEFQGTGATDGQGQVMAKAVNAVLRTVSLDTLVANPALDAETVREWIREPIDTTKMMDDLPQGPDELPVPDSDIAAVKNFLLDLAKRIDLAGTSSTRKKSGHKNF